MQKGAKILGLFLLGLVFTSMLIGVVEAKTILDSLKEGAAGLFAGSVSQDTQSYIAKILLIFLVALLVYAISAALPFVPDNEVIRWAVSIIVAILSFLFVSLENIKYLMVNYEALGIALTTFLPLIILLVFTAEFREKEKPGIACPVNKLILILFALYIGFRWLTVDYAGENPPALAYAYPLTLVITLIWIALEGAFAKWWRKEKTTAQAEAAGQVIDQAAAGAATLAAVPEKINAARTRYHYKS